MLTILLEVKRNDGIQYNQFYNPSPKEFKKYPRTENGIKKAIKELTETAQKYNWISEYQFKVYEGKFESYKKDMIPIFIVDSVGNIIQEMGITA